MLATARAPEVRCKARRAPARNAFERRAVGAPRPTACAELRGLPLRQGLATACVAGTSFTLPEGTAGSAAGSTGALDRVSEAHPPKRL